MSRRTLAVWGCVLGLAFASLPLASGPAVAAAPTASISVTPSGSVWDNQVVKVNVDFPTSTYDGVLYGNYPWLAIYKENSGSWTKVGSGVKSTSAGVYAFDYNVGTSPSTIKVCNDPTHPSGQSGAFYNDPTKQLCTATKSFHPQTPPPTSLTLTSTNPNGKTWTASYTGPTVSGKTVYLQLQTIATKMTGEVGQTATTGLAGEGPYTAVQTWKTVATATTSSTGVASFSISNPYEVKHNYRAVTSDNMTTSNSVSLAASQSAKATKVPQVYLSTNEQATIDTRSRYFEGSFDLVNPGDSNFSACSTMLDKDGNPVASSKRPLLVAAKGRGNYSWSFAKKSYTIKLDKSTNLCGMGASKKWALVANHYDKSLMRNSVASELGSKFDKLWTPESVPVDLWINGSYRGSYILIERIAVAANRVNIAEATQAVADTGFILEWDFRKGADKNVTAGGYGYVGLKEPEYDLDPFGRNTGKGVTQEQVDFINNYLDKAASALDKASSNNDWMEYIDVDSAVDYYLAMEYMKPIDGNMWASVYMYKDAGGKLKFGPMWDFDMSSGDSNRAGGAMSPTGWYLRNVITTTAKQSTYTWFNRLNQNSSFRSKVADRWNQLRSTLKLDSFVASQKAKVSLTAAENWKVWSHSQQLSSTQVIKSSWSADVDYLKSWVASRWSWLDGQY